MQNGNGKKLIFDIDGTVFDSKGLEDGYENYQIIESVSNFAKKAKNLGWDIGYYTARGSKSKFNFQEKTKQQIALSDLPSGDIEFGKPDADWYIDDKGINARNVDPIISSISVEERIWGKEYLLYSDQNYSMKRLEVEPGKSLSKQYHREKHETLHIVEGFGYAEINGEFKTISVGDTLIFEPKTIHRIMASEKCFKLVIIESSTTHLQDIVRVEVYD